MPKFTIVAVLGIPSLNTRDFFNSIKFESWEVDAMNRDSASLDHDPASRPNWNEMTSGEYQVLNWYTFPVEERHVDGFKE